MHTQNESILLLADMSASLVSKVIPLDQMFTYIIQFFWTGSPVGTWTLEVSADIGQTPDGGGVTNWTTYAGSGNPISAAGNGTYVVTVSAERWARLVYTRTSGSGTVTSARVNAKGE